MILIAVVIPTVLFFANQVLRPAQEIKAYAEDVLEHGVALSGELDAVPKLAETRRLTVSAREAVSRYGTALLRLM
ncbi:MAG: hypothetical protein ACRDZ9_02450 [Acidimicrobiales bacterium]